MLARPRGLYVLVASMSLCGAACAVVKPYERRRLAKPDMAEEGDAGLMAGQEHATDYREGAAGGFGGGGGGCGCN